MRAVALTPPSWERLVAGSGTVLAARIASQALKLGAMLVLARMLAPEAFGLVGIGLVVLAAVTTLTEPGFESALVQRRGDIEPYFAVTFTWNLIRGSVLAVLIWIAAPPVSSVFGQPAAAAVIRALIPVVLLESLISPRIVELKRELQFTRLARWELAEAVASCAAAVGLGLLLRSVWAIPLAMVAGHAARAALSWQLAPWRPRLAFDLAKSRALGKFGVWVLLTNAMVFLLLYMDDAVVGGVAGVTALGLYQVAFRIASLPATEIGHVAGRLSFPAFAQVQTDIAVLRTRWLGGLRLVAVFCLPLAAAIALAAPYVPTVVLTGDWAPIVPLLQILALFGAFRALNAVAGGLFYAVGRPAVNAGVSAVQLAIVAAGIVPAVRIGGAVGAAALVTGANALALGLLLVEARSVVRPALADLLRCFAPALAITALLSAALLLTSLVIPSGWPDGMRLSALVGLTLCCALAVLHELRKPGGHILAAGAGT